MTQNPPGWWRAFKGAFPGLAMFLEHAGAVIVIVSMLELIRRLLLWFGEIVH